MRFKKIAAIHRQPKVTVAKGELSTVYLSIPGLQCFLYFVVVAQSTVVILTVVVITLVIIAVVIIVSIVVIVTVLIDD